MFIILAFFATMALSTPTAAPVVTPSPGSFYDIGEPLSSLPSHVIHAACGPGVEHRPGARDCTVSDLSGPPVTCCEFD